MTEVGRQGPKLDDLFARLGNAQEVALRAAPALAVPVSARPQWRARRVVALGLALGLGLVLVFALRARTPDNLFTATTSELPLVFADGSTAVFAPGAAGRLVARDERGAEVEIVRGRLTAHVVHADKTRWVFRAGPFAVRVTGTRFDVDWSPATGELAVSLHEGAVTVDGAVLGAGVPLRAGQRLRVARGPVPSVAVTEMTETAPLPNEAPAPGTAPAEAPAPLPSAGPTPAESEHRSEPGTAASSGWRALVERGAYAAAWRAAERSGIAKLTKSLDAAGLLALADAARYTGHSAEARIVFAALVDRFATHHLAADAVFSLGRLAFEAGDPATAARWFSRYETRWPEGALAEEALGRLAEAAAAAGETPRAQAAARAYLDRAPAGPYAPLARRILAEPAATGAPR